MVACKLHLLAWVHVSEWPEKLGFHVMISVEEDMLCFARQNGVFCGVICGVMEL